MAVGSFNALVLQIRPASPFYATSKQMKLAMFSNAKMASPTIVF